MPRLAQPIATLALASIMLLSHLANAASKRGALAQTFNPLEVARSLEKQTPILINSYVLPSGLQLDIFRKSAKGKEGCVKWLPLTESSETLIEPRSKAGTKSTVVPDRLVAVFALKQKNCELISAESAAMSRLRINPVTEIPNLAGYRLRVSPPQTIIKLAGAHFVDELKFSFLGLEDSQKSKRLVTESIEPEIPRQALFRYLPGLTVFINPAIASTQLLSPKRALDNNSPVLSTFGGGTGFNLFFLKALKFQFEIYQSIQRIQLVENNRLPGLYNFFLFGLQLEIGSGRRFYIPAIDIGANINRLDAGFASGNDRASFKVNSISSSIDLYWDRFAPSNSRMHFFKKLAYLSETRFALKANDGSKKISNTETKNTLYWHLSRDTLLGLGHWYRSIKNENFSYNIQGLQISLKVNSIFQETL